MKVSWDVNFITGSVVKFRGKVDEAGYQSVIRKLGFHIKEQGAGKTGGLITAVHVLYLESGVSDMEIYMPINKAISSTAEFTCLPSFSLENCMSFEFKGTPHLIPRAYTDLYNKAKGMGVKLNQPFYNVFEKEPDSFWYAGYTEMIIYASIVK